jgi:hypothetical protein
MTGGTAAPEVVVVVADVVVVFGGFVDGGEPVRLVVVIGLVVLVLPGAVLVVTGSGSGKGSPPGCGRFRVSTARGSSSACGQLATTPAPTASATALTTSFHRHDRLRTSSLRRITKSMMSAQTPAAVPPNHRDCGEWW